MAYKIIQDKCKACGACKENCPVDAISETDGVFAIIDSDCVDCGTCESNCPHDAIAA
ncbi:MAG: 4Fe-4S binding protein [Oscillospiraceae bacterium]|jgi:NAD-dependent dihydropyrimidine dehydrogenase PreA subunit|nr:4Fe-4S binding protein [Oscillospiraceae bacterium]